jgi:hypothetical protein
VAAAAQDHLATTGQVRAGAFAVPLEDGREVRLIEVPTHDHALMVVVSDGSSVLDAILMQHAATVVALEMSQALMAVEHQRRAGAELLAQLTDARIEPRSGRRQLVTAGLDPARIVMVSATAPDPARLREVHIALWQRNTPHISLHRSGLVQLLLREDHTAETNLLHALGDGGRIGISAPEEIQLSGTLLVVTSETQSASGGLVTTYHFQPQGISGVGLTSGDMYRGTGTTHDVTVQNPAGGNEFTYVDRFRLVGTQGEPTFSVSGIMHVTTTPAGDITAYVNNFTTSCS